MEDHPRSYFGVNFITQKLLAPPPVGVAHLFDPKSISGRNWAQCVSAAIVPHFHVVMHVLNGIPSTSQLCMATETAHWPGGAW